MKAPGFGAESFSVQAQLAMPTPPLCRVALALSSTPSLTESSFVEASHKDPAGSASDPPISLTQLIAPVVSKRGRQFREFLLAGRKGVEKAALLEMKTKTDPGAEF